MLFPIYLRRVSPDTCLPGAAGWLESLHRPNVELVADPVVRISETGLHTASGRFVPVDVIIFATVSPYHVPSISFAHQDSRQRGPMSPATDSA